MHRIEFMLDDGLHRRNVIGSIRDFLQMRRRLTQSLSNSNSGEYTNSGPSSNSSSGAYSESSTFSGPNSTSNSGRHVRLQLRHPGSHPAADSNSNSGADIVSGGNPGATGFFHKCEWG